MKESNDNNKRLQPLHYENKLKKNGEKNVEKIKALIGEINTMDENIKIYKKGTKTTVSIEGEDSYITMEAVETDHLRNYNFSEVDRNISAEERIQQVRDNNGKMTQEETALRSGTSQGYVSRINKKHKKNK